MAWSKLRPATIVATAWWALFFGVQPAHSANINVEYTGTDPVGREIAFELRERVAASSQHTLVYNRKDAAFSIILVTVGTKDQIAAAYSAVLVWKNYAHPEGLDFFVTTIAGNCGRNVAERCAADILAGLDQEINSIVSEVTRALTP